MPGEKLAIQHQQGTKGLFFFHGASVEDRNVCFEMMEMQGGHGKNGVVFVRMKRWKEEKHLAKKL